MLFEEYIKIFTEVLVITEKIEALCAKLRSEEAEPLFHERNVLMQKLSVPEDIDDEKFAKVLAIKEKISQLNEKILKDMKREKEKADRETTQVRNNISAGQYCQETTEMKLKNNYKNPKYNGDGSIFS